MAEERARGWRPPRPPLVTRGRRGGGGDGDSGCGVGGCGSAPWACRVRVQAPRRPWGERPLREQAVVTSAAAAAAATAAFLVCVGLLSRSYVASQAAPVVQVTLTAAAVLDLPVVTVCPSLREVPHFSGQPTAAHPGHPIMAVRAVSDWEGGTQVAYPNVLSSGVVEMVDVGTAAAAAPFVNCTARLNAMSVPRVSSAYDGVNGLRPVPGEDPAIDGRCRTCVRLGRSPRRPLEANRQAAGLPTGVTLSITTSDAFQYCVDRRRRNADVTPFVYSRLLSAVSEKIVEYGDELQARGILSLGGEDLTPRWSSGEFRWFSYSLDPQDFDLRHRVDRDMSMLIGFHCNVYFFSGFFYPTDDPPGGVRYRLDEQGLWQRSGSGPYFDVTGEPAFEGVSTPPAFHVLSPYPANPAKDDSGGEAVTAAAPAARQVVAWDGRGVRGWPAAEGFGDDDDDQPNTPPLPIYPEGPASVAPPGGAPLRRFLKTSFVQQFVNRSALHMVVHTEDPATAAADGSGLSRSSEVALVGQGERFLRLGLARSVDFSGAIRYAAADVARSELSMPRLRHFEPGIFSEWLFDFRYTSFVTATASEAAAVSTAQYAADVANYFGAFTGLSTFTLLIVPANLVAGWVGGRAWGGQGWGGRGVGGGGGRRRLLGGGLRRALVGEGG